MGGMCVEEVVERARELAEVVRRCYEMVDEGRRLKKGLEKLIAKAIEEVLGEETMRDVRVEAGGVVMAMEKRASGAEVYITKHGPLPEEFRRVPMDELRLDPLYSVHGFVEDAGLIAKELEKKIGEAREGEEAIRRALERVREVLAPLVVAEGLGR